MKRHTTITRFPVLLGAVALIVALWHVEASAASPVLITGFDLKPRPVTLQGLDDRGMGFFDAARRYTTQSLADVLIIAMTEADGAAVRVNRTLVQADPGVLELIDGQRLAGAVAGASEDGQSVVWSHPTIGRVTVSLEKLRSITMRGEPLPHETAATDVVVLANGDRLSGFVASVSAEQVKLQSQGDGKAIELPTARVRTIWFAAATMRHGKGHRVILRDGSALLTPTLAVADDALTFRPTMTGDEKDVTLPLAVVARLEVESPKGRLLGLERLPHRVVSGGEVFGVPTPARLEGAVLKMHAPMVIEWALPAGAERFMAVAELDNTGVDPMRFAAWADTELVAKVDGKEVGRWRLREGTPTAALNIETRGAALSLELLPGTNGPVLDRVRLREVSLLVAGEPQ